MALLESNVVVTLTRSGAVVLRSIPGMVTPPGPENISPEGVIVSTTVLLDPLPAGVTIKTGDQMVFESMGGHLGVGQVPKRNVLSAPLMPMAAGFEDLAVVKVMLQGTLQ